ncbi:DUF1549 and DUF1553 domain-containing protein [Pirellulaceae bacterium SH449]
MATRFQAILFLKLSSTSLPRSFCLMVLAWVVILFPGYETAFANEPNDNEPNNSLPKFELDIQPILTARGCNSGPCHGKSRGQNGFALSLFGFDSDMDFDSLVKNARGRRISLSNPHESLLLKKATGEEPHGGGIRLQPDDDDYKTLSRWIETGLHRTSSEDPVLVGLKMQPDPRQLSPKESIQVGVIATYSDGTQRDVTQVTAFQSSDAGIISPKQPGLLVAGEYVGEASIMARYMGHIATWNSAVVASRLHKPEDYKQLPQNNWIDDLVYQKLEQLDFWPSDLCDDNTFLRRLFLDSIGRLPRPDEVESFMEDRSPDKRERWIEYALNQPEYGNFWANKWADLLRPNPYRVGIKATYALDVWLREVFRANLPHDQFVRDLLTAQGSTWRNGATTFFRDRREPEEITSVVSQLFLGVRLECAKCHQHPFEVYGQSDFYGIASYFSRIGHKGVGLSPPISGSEEIFFAKTSGNVKHPITQQAVAPKPLREEGIAIDKETDPREVFADWLLKPENPYFARAGANRLWAEVMGIGIVDAVDDFRATNPPSNAPLLDRLAEHFVQSGFDNKALLKTIFSSRIYQLASMPNDSNKLDYRNFSRHYRKRMRAEVLADALSEVTGIPTSFDGVPAGTSALELWTFRVPSELLDAFSRPDANQDPPCERLADTTMSQSLHLMNSNQIQSRLTSDEGLCAKWAAKDAEPRELVREIYLRIYSRLPSPDEYRQVSSVIESATNKRHAVEDIVWSMINSPEFSFID